MDTKQPRITVGVVEGRRAVHPVVPIKHIRVEPSVHSFSESAGREGTASTHHDVQYTDGNEIFVLMRTTLQTDNHMGHGGVHRNGIFFQFGSARVLG